MLKIAPGMQEWISGHLNDDPATLRLRYHGREGYDMAITQIECRRRAATRLPLALSFPGFIFPTALSAEQATSEALARIHADIAGYGPGIRHLDLTCGLGIDAFEAARRGASVTAVDLNPLCAEAARNNAEVMGLAHLFTAVEGDSERFVADTSEKFHSLFIDPARRGEGGRRLVSLTDCTPDVTTILPRLLAIAPRVIIKASPMLDITAMAIELNRAAGEKGGVSRMIATGTTRECKELIAVVERAFDKSYSIEAITVIPGYDNYAVFAASGRNEAAPVAESLPTTGMYIYEPYPAVMKTAAWGALTSLSPELRQLHPNTHLYVSSGLVEGFPGKVMLIERVEPFNKHSLKEIACDYPKLNVASRNFILTAPELARRLRVKEGGDKQLYGVRATPAATPAIIISRHL